MNSEHLDNFLTEVFRVHGPAVSNFYAQAFRNFKLGDLKVYKGTGVIMSFYTLQKKPEYFDDPLKFDLKKYEDKKKIKQMKKGILVPFGGGKRNCPGKSLAMMSIKIFVANLVNMFEIKPSSVPNPRVTGMTCTVSHSIAKFRVLE